MYQLSMAGYKVTQLDTGITYGQLSTLPQIAKLLMLDLERPKRIPFSIFPRPHLIMFHPKKGPIYFVASGEGVRPSADAHQQVEPSPACRGFGRIAYVWVIGLSRTRCVHVSPATVELFAAMVTLIIKYTGMRFHE